MNEREIFAEALERRDSAERQTYLDEVCGADLELRQRIEVLLRAHDDAGSFLDKLPDEIDAVRETNISDQGVKRTSQDDAWRSLLGPTESPDRLGTSGTYEVIELVGRGGMGVVLRAFDPKLKRIVAIKLLAPELATSATAVKRFLREARAAAAVSHDHVVSIYAIDDEARPPRIVMEMIDGQSLQQKIDKAGALDVRSILRIGMQTAAGLSAAHRQGLVHRDIKPANILLENGIEKVKLTDFGLARAIDDISMTQTGQITGTPQYMSPEQAQGQRVDHRTDLFSLGCVLYAMCTGRAAFRADSAVAVLHRIVHDTPRPIREINEDIPDWLCAIVDKLLAKRPEDRFDSAEDVGELLGRHLAHLQQPLSVPKPECVGQMRPVTSRVPPLDARLERELNQASWTFAVVGFACMTVTFLAYAANDQSWYSGAEIVFWLMLAGTVIVFPIVMLASIRLDFCRLVGRHPGPLPLLASKVAVIPWNPLLLILLPLTIRARRILLRPEVRVWLEGPAGANPHCSDEEQSPPERTDRRTHHPSNRWLWGILFAAVPICSAAVIRTFTGVGIGEATVVSAILSMMLAMGSALLLLVLRRRVGDEPAQQRDETGQAFFKSLTSGTASAKVALLVCVSIFIIVAASETTPSDPQMAEARTALCLAATVLFVVVWGCFGGVRSLLTKQRQSGTQPSAGARLAAIVFLLALATVSFMTRWTGSSPSQLFDSVSRYLSTAVGRLVSSDIPYEARSRAGLLAFAFDDVALVFEGTSIHHASRGRGVFPKAGGVLVDIEMAGRLVKVGHSSALPGINTVRINDYTFHLAEDCTQLALPLPDGSSQTWHLNNIARPLTIFIAADGTHRIGKPSTTPAASDRDPAPQTNTLSGE